MSENWDLVFVLRDVADVRRAHDIVHRQQRIVRIAHRFGLVDVHRRQARPAGAQRLGQGVRCDQPRTACVDQQGRGLHPRKVARPDNAARGLHEAHMQRDHVAGIEEALLVRRRGPAVRLRPRQRVRPRPDKHVHPERSSVAGDHRADAAVTVDSQRLASQRVADADLPMAGLHRRGLLGNLPHRRQHKRPGQLRGRIGRSVRVQI